VLIIIDWFTKTLKAERNMARILAVDDESKY
jgi:hypothetical protein